jgi:hypothetical protein
VSTNSNAPTSAGITQKRIISLLNELPPESLAFVERFVQFLRDQAREGPSTASSTVQEKRPPYVYPTVTVASSTLDEWVDLVPEGYEGDALADTEALYDEV